MKMKRLSIILTSLVLLLALAGTGWSATNYYCNGRMSMSGSVTSGAFTPLETITQASTSATAYYWGLGTGVMYASGVTGSPDTTDIWTGAISGATWTPSTAPAATTYTDPGGAAWGAGSDSNNGTSKSTPKLTFYAAVTVVGNANNNTLTIAPASYIHSTSYTQLTTANETGIVMQGADPLMANWPIIDGSGLTGAYACRLRGGTIVQYMKVIKCNLTANFANNTAALCSAIDGSNILITRCYFNSNAYDITPNSASTITATYCIFSDPAVYSINTKASFTGAAAILNVYFNKFYGAYLGKSSNYFTRLTANSDVNPTVNIYNNIFAGGDAVAILVDPSYKGALNIKNNDFRGMTTYAVTVSSGGTTPTLSNNSYIAGGWPASSYTDLHCYLSNCGPDSSPVTDQELYAGSRGTGYIIFRKDDAPDTSTTNLNYCLALAQKLQSYGWSLSYAAVVFESTYGNVNAGIPLGSVSGSFLAGETVNQAVSGFTGTVLSWDGTNNVLYLVWNSYTGQGTNLTTQPFDLTHTITGATSLATGIPNDVSAIVAQTRQLQAAGAELTCHTWSHAALDNTTAFTISYTGSGSWSLAVTSSGSPPSDAETLTVTESTSGLSASINLATGVLTNDTWDQTLQVNQLNDLQGVRNYLASKAFFTVGTISTTTCAAAPYFTKSRDLDVVSFSGAGSKTVLVNDTRLRYYELHDAIAWWSNIGITLSNTLIYPFFFYDANTITDAMAYGFTCGLQNTTTGAYTSVGSQLKQVQMFEIPMNSMLDTMNLSNAALQKWANQLCEALATQLKVITIMTHGPDQGWTSAQQDIVFQEIKRHPNIQVVSASQFQNIIANSGPWKTADSGKTYTRDYSQVADNFTGPGANSALVGTGASVGLTTDYYGNFIPTGLNSIGVVQYQPKAVGF